MTIYSLFGWDEVAGLVGLLKQPAHPASASPAISERFCLSIVLDVEGCLITEISKKKVKHHMKLKTTKCTKIYYY